MRQEVQRKGLPTYPARRGWRTSVHALHVLSSRHCRLYFRYSKEHANICTEFLSSSLSFSRGWLLAQRGKPQRIAVSERPLCTRGKMNAYLHSRFNAAAIGIAPAASQSTPGPGKANVNANARSADSRCSAIRIGIPQGEGAMQIEQSESGDPSPPPPPGKHPQDNTE